MVKHTQTIPRLLLRNCLNVFDHFVELALKRLNLINNEREIYFTLCDKKFIGLVKNFKTFYFHFATIWVCVKARFYLSQRCIQYPVNI